MERPSSSEGSPINHLLIQADSPVSSVSILKDFIIVGSDNGSLFVYDISTNKTRLMKEIIGLPGEISSIALQPNKSSGIWLASGSSALHFNLDSEEDKLRFSDAEQSIILAGGEDDILNKLVQSINGNYLAFCTDNGFVGIVELSTRKVTKMRTKHDSICDAISFIPDRSNELVSGGYDMALLHHEFSQNIVLSRTKIDALQMGEGTLLSPPFIMSISISTDGVIAAGTADGRLWMGFGGQRVKGKKKARRWEGLKDYETVTEQIAEGPIVGLAFNGIRNVISCTLLGTVKEHRITRDSDDIVVLHLLWKKIPHKIEKVNAFAVSDPYIAVGGFGTNRKGYVEVWRIGK